MWGRVGQSGPDPMWRVRLDIPISTPRMGWMGGANQSGHLGRLWGARLWLFFIRTLTGQPAQAFGAAMGMVRL